MLVDGVSKNDETTLSGRCDSSKIVNFKGDKSLIGKYIDVKLPRHTHGALTVRLQNKKGI